MKTAILVTDMQRDFCEGGALAVPGGNAVAERIRTHLDTWSYDLTIASKDTHWPLAVDPSGNCGHLAIPPAEPDYVHTWPEHCVKGTPGWAFHELLDPLDFDIRVEKGQGVPAYSAFEGSIVRSPPVVNDHLSLGRFNGAVLGSVLTALDIDKLVVVGLALDHCVYRSARDALLYGMQVEIIRDLSAAVDDERAATQLRNLGYLSNFTLS